VAIARAHACFVQGLTGWGRRFVIGRKCTGPRAPSGVSYRPLID
jgi:hypothetical protein